MYSNAGDMLIFLEHYMGGERAYLLKQLELLAVVNKETNTSIGMEWFQKEDMFYHMGGTGCFESSIAINRKRNKGVVIMSNYRSLISPYKNMMYLLKLIMDS